MDNMNSYAVTKYNVFSNKMEMKDFAPIFLTEV